MRPRGEPLHHVAQSCWVGDRAELRLPLALHARGLGGEATEWCGFRRGGNERERAEGDDYGNERAHGPKLVCAPACCQAWWTSRLLERSCRTTDSAAILLGDRQGGQLGPFDVGSSGTSMVRCLPHGWSPIVSDRSD